MNKNPFDVISSEENDEEHQDIVMNLSNNIEEGFDNDSKPKSIFMIKLMNQKKILKSITFGLLFYLLANPRSFKYTNILTNKLDKILVHTIIFSLLVYIIMETI